jgi:hypothetical protein
MVAAGQKLDAIQMIRKRYGYDLKQAEEFIEQLLK